MVFHFLVTSSYFLVTTCSDISLSSYLFSYILPSSNACLSHFQFTDQHKKIKKHVKGYELSQSLVHYHKKCLLATLFNGLYNAIGNAEHSSREKDWMNGTRKDIIKYIQYKDRIQNLDDIQTKFPSCSKLMEAWIQHETKDISYSRKNMYQRERGY